MASRVAHNPPHRKRHAGATWEWKRSAKDFGRKIRTWYRESKAAPKLVAYEPERAGRRNISPYAQIEAENLPLWGCFVSPYVVDSVLRY